jgi:hypothetical protein
MKSGRQGAPALALEGESYRSAAKALGFNRLVPEVDPD